MNEKNLRILILGGDSSAADKNSGLAKRAAEYGELADKYLVVVPAENYIENFVSENIKIYGTGGKNVNSFWGRAVALLKIYKLANKLITFYGVNVISAQDPFEFAFLGFLLAKKYKIGLNIQEHGDFFSRRYWRDENAVNFVRYYLGKFLIKRADSVRVVSERVAETLAGALKINPRKIIKFPIFIDINEQADVRADIELRKKYQDKFIFLTMARLVKQKNLPLLFRAFKKVSLKNSDVLMVVLGRGPEKQKLARLASELELEDKLLMLDWTDKKYAFFKAADCYVLSSNYEGWGMVIIEAAACGKPIVMTDVGCAGEVIKNNESGLIAPIGDEDAFARAMIKIMEDGALREKLSAGSLAAVRRLPGKEETLGLYGESWEMAIKLKNKSKRVKYEIDNK